MDLYHRSIMSNAIGTHLLPMAYWHGNDARVSFIYFHELREKAMKWSSNRMCGYVLYRISSEDIDGLESHRTPQIWRTKNPIPFTAFEILERRDNPTTLPGLPEMIHERAAEYAGLVTL